MAAQTKQPLIAVLGKTGQLASCIRDEAANYPELSLAFVSSREFDVADEAAPTPRPIATADVVVYTAAFHDLAACEACPDRAFAVNAAGVANVLRRTKKDALLVYISTDYVFGADSRERRPAPEPYTEADEPCPVGVYGTSKAQGEAITLDDERGVVLRTASLFSRYGSTGKKGLNFGILVAAAMRRGEALAVDNETRMTPGYGPAVARTILDLALARPSSPRVVHAVCQSPPISWFEFARLIADHVAPGTSRHIRPRTRDTSVPRPAFSALKPTAGTRWALSLADAVRNFAATLAA